MALPQPDGSCSTRDIGILEATAEDRQQVFKDIDYVQQPWHFR